MQQAEGDRRPRIEWPGVAVVIPAYNEERFIGKCLVGTADLDYPADRLDVVVVDNGSVDRTREIAIAQGVTVLELPEGLVGAVRNYGVAATSSEYLAFIDSDCVPRKDWLKHAVSVLEASDDVGGVGGVCLTPDDASWIEQAWAQIPHVATRERSSLPAANMVMRRRDFDAIGGFDETMSAGEDYEISRRLIDRGLRLLAIPECAVYHYGYPRTLGEVYRRQIWQGSSQLRASTGIKDRALVMVHLFLVCPVLMLVLGAIVGPNAMLTWLPMLINLAIPAASSFYRSRGSSSLGARLVKTIRLYPVYWFYYLGRSVGLLKNYAGLIRGSSAISQKTWSRSSSTIREKEDDGGGG